MTHDPDRANQDKPQSHQAQTDKGALVPQGGCQGNTADAGVKVHDFRREANRPKTSLEEAFDRAQNQQTTPDVSR